jgi:CRISPR-associated protein Cmr3
MNVWILEPRDTLVFRDGRPMRGDGLQMTGHPLPYPSQLAGFVRTRCGSDSSGRFTLADDASALDKLRAVSVRGPWLGLAMPDGSVEHLVPAPRDAVLLAPDEARLVRRLRVGLPATGSGLRHGEATDLEEGFALPLLAAGAREKALPMVPFWRWSVMEEWLTRPSEAASRLTRESLGVDLPPVETRTSVAIDGETMTAREGQLFSVDHRRFVLRSSTRRRDGIHGARALSICFLCDDRRLASGLAPFAGERRIVRLAPSKASIPEVPPRVVEVVAERRRVRVVLMTPGCFDQGWRPNWLLQERDGVRAHLRGAIVGRPDVVSGWDFQLQRPKPGRRLAPTGSTYFLELQGAPDAIRQWARNLWWQPVSDDEQARRDGFGLALLGVDEPVPAEVAA